MPSETGAVHASATCPFPAVAEPSVGAPGATGANGVAVRAFEAGPVPTALVAVTVNEYAVPFVRPLIVQLSAFVEQVAPPGLAVAV